MMRMQCVLLSGWVKNWGTSHKKMVQLNDESNFSFSHVMSLWTMVEQSFVTLHPSDMEKRCDKETVLIQ